MIDSKRQSDSQRAIVQDARNPSEEIKAQLTLRGLKSISGHFHRKLPLHLAGARGKLLKCLVINLDRSSDRLAHMEVTFARLGLPFERVPAVDGRMLSEEEIAARVAARPFKRDLTRGEVGCFLSHRRCWEIIAKGRDRHVAVFEDDVLISDSIKEVLGKRHWIRTGLDIVKLETFLRACIILPPKAKIGHTFSICRLLSRHAGAAAYIISRKHARFLLEITDLVTGPVDNTLFDPEYDTCRERMIYQIVPAPCIQDFTLRKQTSVFGSLIARERMSSRGEFRSKPATLQKPETPKKKKKAKRPKNKKELTIRDRMRSRLRRWGFKIKSPPPPERPLAPQKVPLAPDLQREFDAHWNCQGSGASTC